MKNGERIVMNMTLEKVRTVLRRDSLNPGIKRKPLDKLMESAYKEAKAMLGEYQKLRAADVGDEYLKAFLESEE